MFPPSPSKWLRYVTVEPAYFLYTLAATVSDFVNTNLYLQKACRPPATAEPDLSTPCDDHEKGVSFVANVNAYVTSVKMIVVLVAIIVLSSWSDRAGRKRKFFIMLPMVGLLLESLLNGGYAYAWSSAPLAAALTSAAVQMAFGNFPTMQIFSCMYLADVVDRRSRTMRLGFLTAFKVVSQLAGKSVSGFLLRAVGFFWSYAVCATLAALAVALAYACVDDISTAAANGASKCSILNVCRLVDSWRRVFGDRTAKERATVALLFVLFAGLMFAHEGQYTVQYLYLRYKFNWNEAMYSVFSFYGSLATIVGTLFSSVILSRILKLHDGLIGIVSAIWDAAVVICYVYAFADWQLYLISGLDLFYGVSITVCVSLVTKFYDSSQMGDVFAVKQMFCLLIPFSHLAYSLLFQSTLNTIPYAFFFISFGLYLLAAFVYCVIYVLTRKIE